MLENEFGKAGQKSSGLLMLIYFFQHLFTAPRKTCMKLFSQTFRHFLSKIIEHQFLAQVGSRSFIGQYPPKIGYIINNFLPIIQTGIWTGAQDAGNARLAPA